MDTQKADAKLQIVLQDEEARRIYEFKQKAYDDWISKIYHKAKKEEIEEARRLHDIWEKAFFDWVSGMNHARREGRKEGIKLAIARNMIKRNRPIDEIIEDTGLTREEVESLR